MNALALAWAAAKGDIKTVQELLKSGANIDKKYHVMRGDGVASVVDNEG